MSSTPVLPSATQWCAAQLFLTLFKHNFSFFFFRIRNQKHVPKCKHHSSHLRGEQISFCRTNAERSNTLPWGTTYWRNMQPWQQLWPDWSDLNALLNVGFFVRISRCTSNLPGVIAISAGLPLRWDMSCEIVPCSALQTKRVKMCSYTKTSRLE